VLTTEQTAGDAAILIEGLGGYNRLMRGNLEYAVCGGIDNEVTCLKVFLTIFSDHCGARIRQVAEYASACQARELVKELLGEATRVCGKGSV
jgi:hypothetical protein